MKIFVNNEEVIFDGDGTSGEKISELMKTIRGKNLIILETKIDGVVTREDILELLKINQIGQVEVTVTNQHNLIIEGLDTALDYLPVLQKGLEEIAGLFQEGREGEGIALFLEAHTGLDWLEHILRGSRIYFQSSNRDLGVQFAEVAEGYNEKLTELTKAWENRDYVLIADLLEYELAPFIEEIMPLINKVMEAENHKGE
ncbi:MAG: hypothetical protein M0Z31_03590 [Clostridia bacterium]|nr:hypothetical protein [Clostridia bacterium]